LGDDCGGAHGGDDVLRNGSGGAPAKSRTGVSFELLVLSFQIFKTYYILSIFFFTFCYYCFILLHVIYLEVLHVKLVDVNFVLNMSHFSFKYFILKGLKLRISHFK